MSMSLLYTVNKHEFDQLTLLSREDGIDSFCELLIVLLDQLDKNRAVQRQGYHGRITGF